MVAWFFFVNDDHEPEVPDTWPWLIVMTNELIGFDQFELASLHPVHSVVFDGLRTLSLQATLDDLARSIFVAEARPGGG